MNPDLAIRARGRAARSVALFAHLLVIGGLFCATPAHALTITVPDRKPSVVGETLSFRAVTTDSTGTIEYRWDFGDGTRTEFTAGLSEVEHTYDAAGHYPIIVVIRDEDGFTSTSFVHTVHYPLTPHPPQSSTSIIYDESRNLIYTVDPDNDTVNVVDPVALTKLGEVPVYRGPEALALAPDGKLWVVHSDDYAIAVVDPDQLSIVSGFRLPYASQPMGLAISPTGDAAYVTLMALGRLLKLDSTTGATLGQVEVGPWARGVAVSHDGQDVYVTRFISSSDHGQVVQVDGSTLEVNRRFELAPDMKEDTAQQGRGLPNYLFSVGLSPDGRQAWIPGKKDNIFRGSLRDGLELQQENTVRAMISVLDLHGGTEVMDQRMDLDDRNLPIHVEFSSLGDYAFVTLAGSGMIEVRDVFTSGFVTGMQDAGIGPRGSVLGPEGRLFVHGFLSRSVVVYDVSDVLTSTDTITRRIAEIPMVEQEKLAPEVLRGKQIFYDSSDKRMTGEGYISCASCHFDGFEDGRVWDFTNLGEGLRNTTSLLGRRGMGHGPVHWSGNFDEIQDFEHPIRALFGGTGFLPSDVPLGEPLGTPKAGLSEELDALAAYVTSLDQVHPSPHRNADGSMTDEAKQGEALFMELGCHGCHSGPDFTDSAMNQLHDVGTLKPSSGSRLGAELPGIDTPTLLGIWETAPYLHDGSAATLRDVLTTSNPHAEHGPTSHLTSEQVDQLVAYLLQLDNELPLRELPFELDADVEPGSGESTASGGCGCRWIPSSGLGSTTLPWPLMGWLLTGCFLLRLRARRQCC